MCVMKKLPGFSPWVGLLHVINPLCCPSAPCYHLSLVGHTVSRGVQLGETPEVSQKPGAARSPGGYKGIQLGQS